MMERKSKAQYFWLAVLLVITVLLIVMVIQIFPLIEDIVTDPKNAEASLTNQINQIGDRAAPALLSLSALQIIVPFIPGPVVGIITGLKYGIFIGPVIFLAGIALGSLLVMVFMRKLIHLFHRKQTSKKPSEKIRMIDRVNHMEHPEILACLFVLIPFISSFGPYLFASTKISIPKYIVAVLIGSVPSTVLYMVVGSHIYSGNYTTAIIIVGVALVLIVLALVFRKRLMDFIFSSKL